MCCATAYNPEKKKQRLNELHMISYGVPKPPNPFLEDDPLGGDPPIMLTKSAINRAPWGTRIPDHESMASVLYEELAANVDAATPSKDSKSKTSPKADEQLATQQAGDADDVCFHFFFRKTSTCMNNVTC